MAAKKKSFKAELENPAMAFISTATAEEQTQEPEAAAEPAQIEEPAQGGRRPRREMKSKRVMLLLRPSIHEAVYREAERRGLSVNDTYNVLLSEKLGL